MSKILIVDDHPAIRLALRALLENNNFSVVAEADNSADAVRLAQERKPDIVIVEPAIPRLDVSALTSRLVSLGLTCKVIALTSQPAEVFCSRYIESGIKAYIIKDEDLSSVATAIKAVMKGYSIFPENIQSRASQSKLDHSTEQLLIQSLTDREITILKHLSLGYSNKNIGEMLFLSNKTVSTYKARIYQKLGLKSVVEMAAFSKRNSLIA